MLYKQPKQFYLIFLIELIERFGYYGLQSIIIIYLIKKISLPEEEIINFFSSFTALTYGLVVVGGWIGDNFLGTKRILMLGIITLILGYGTILIFYKNINIIYFGISILSIGISLFKSAPSSLLSNIYKKKSPLRDEGFNIYYMAINIGSLLSIIITPWLTKNFGWTVSFSLPFISLIINLIIFLKYKNIINGSKCDYLPLNNKKILLTIIGLIIFPIIILYILNNIYITNNLIKIIISIIFFTFVKKFINLNKKKKKKMIVAFLLIIESTIFFILYNQIPTSLNFFTIRNVKHCIFGINISPEQFQALNPFWIIIISPILTYIYNLSKNKLSIIYKFAIGMILCSISFIIIPIGIYLDTNSQGLISSNWLIISYALQSSGELMISGSGLSMISQLVPKNLIGFTIGTWFLTTSIAIIISGKIANLMTFPKNISIDKFYSLNIYFNNFLKIGMYGLLISLIILLISPILNSMIKKQ